MVGIVTVAVEFLQGGPVPFVQEEQGAVLEDLVDELVEEVGPGRR